MWRQVGGLCLLGIAGDSWLDAPREKQERMQQLRTLHHRLHGVRKVAVLAKGSPDVLHSPVVNQLIYPSANAEETSSADHLQQGSVNVMTVEGIRRFQALYALLVGHSKDQRIVVHFTTPQVCSFICDVVYALQELPPEVLLLCDSENSAQVRPGGLIEAFDRARGSVILLSAHGLVPRSGRVFIQYDPMVSITNFCSFVRRALLPPLSVAPAECTTGRRRSRTPPPTPTLAAADAPHPQYEHIVVFMYRSEVRFGIPILRSTAAAQRLEVVNLPAPSAVPMALSLSRLKSLHKKIFVIQNKAFEAYRSTMQVYSRLTPKDVYSTETVPLDLVAEQFGFETPPVLDLRTKSTPYRPRRDVYREMQVKLKEDRQRVRQYAREHLVGEGPDEHLLEGAGEAIGGTVALQ
jgi:hypothetical protein